MALLDLYQHAAIETLAQDIYEELRDHLAEGGTFVPVLFLHRLDGPGEPDLLEMVTLEAEEQDSWAAVIASAVERTEATLWALATQVLVRRTSLRSSTTSEELLFVYLVADAAQPQGARVWAAALEPSRNRIEPFEECTNDPRLQLMVQHLTGSTMLH